MCASLYFFCSVNLVCVCVFVEPPVCVDLRLLPAYRVNHLTN